jgi:O-antigen/teichoic acid export membrane protein
MAFWVAAARLFPETTVGRDSVLISVMIELSTLCQLNLGNGIVRFLPDLGARSARALVWVYIVTAGTALVFGALFVMLAPHLSDQLRYLGSDAALGVVFVAGLVCSGVFVLQDAALTATRQTPWIPLENGSFGVLKLAALPLLLALGANNGVFIAWVVPMALLLGPVNYLIFRRALPVQAVRKTPTAALSTLGPGRVLRFLSQDYLASVFTQAALTVLPLLVIAKLGPRESAYFAMPFTIAVAFDTFAYSSCTALVVEATLKPTQLASLLRVFVRRVLVLLVPAAALLAVAAPIVLLPFGHAYEQHGATVLRLLLCASVFRILTALFSALSRIHALGVRLALIELLLCALALGGALALAPSRGIVGVAEAWLLANVVVAAAVAPLVLADLRRAH